MEGRAEAAQTAIEELATKNYVAECDVSENVCEEGNRPGRMFYVELLELGGVQALIEKLASVKMVRENLEISENGERNAGLREDDADPLRGTEGNGVAGEIDGVGNRSAASEQSDVDDELMKNE